MIATAALGNARRATTCRIVVLDAVSGFLGMSALLIASVAVWVSPRGARAIRGRTGLAWSSPRTNSSPRAHLHLDPLRYLSKESSAVPQSGLPPDSSAAVS